jgi:hypothetical protein
MAPMIWAILALLGVPLWLVAGALGAIVFRNRSLRRRPGNIPCRVQTKPGGRWVRGNGIWVHDVFAFRAGLASWTDRLMWVRQVSLRPPSSAEAGKLKRLADPMVAIFLLDDGTELPVAAAGSLQAELSGPLPPTAVTG